MSGKQSKILRAAIYGDQSQKVSNRRYTVLNRSRYAHINGTTINKPGSPRAIYQKTKRGTI